LLSYNVTDLGTLGGNSYGTAINASGQVAGYAGTSNDANPPLHAFLYDVTAAPPLSDLGALGGAANSVARGFNDAGQVVGSSFNTLCSPGSHAFLYDGAATPAMQDLGTLGGTDSDAFGINASGQVVGSSTTAADAQHAFLYDPAATPAMQDLGTLGGATSIARGINSAGRVVGGAYTAGNAQHAFLYDPAAAPAMQDLGTLGGMTSIAVGINASGQVVGTAYTAGGAFHAFRYSKITTPQMQDLGTLGGTNSNAYAINASCRIVGAAYLPGNTVLHAFLYDPSATPAMQDLNSLLPAGSGWVLKTAYAINDNGQIVGFGGVPGGADHAFLLTPHPTVVGTTPALAGGTLAAGTTSLQIQFSEPVLGAGVAANYQLQLVGPDGLLGTPNDVAVPLSASYSGTTATLTFAALPESVYRLTVDQTITNLAGFPLDGTGSGTPGGNYVRDFVGLAPLHGPVTLTSPHGFAFGVQASGTGAGQFVNGSNNAFNGLNRLQVSGIDYAGSQTIPGVSIFQAAGTGSYTTSSSAYQDVPGMSLTFTGNGAPLRLSSSLVFNLSPRTDASFRFVVDGSPQPYSYESNPGSNNDLSQRLYEAFVTGLPSGSHQVKLQAQVIGGGALLLYSIPNGGSESQTLQIQQFNSVPFASLANGGLTVITPLQPLGNLQVHREITVPNTGGQDFARTVDVF
jgi:probable HAF family extracellular repeat protein